MGIFTARSQPPTPKSHPSSPASSAVSNPSPSALGCTGFQKNPSRVKAKVHPDRFLHSLSAKAATFAERKATLIDRPILKVLQQVVAVARREGIVDRPDFALAGAAEAGGAASSSADSLGVVGRAAD